jgi:hypothetical protein
VHQMDIPWESKVDRQGGISWDIPSGRSNVGDETVFV